MGSVRGLTVQGMWYLGVLSLALGGAGCAQETLEPPIVYDDSLLQVIWQEQAASREALDDFVAHYRLAIDSVEQQGELRNTSSSYSQISELRHGMMRHFVNQERVDQNIQFSDFAKTRMGPHQHTASYQFVMNAHESACRHQEKGIDDALNIWFNTNAGELHTEAMGPLSGAQGLDLAAHTFSIRDGFSRDIADDEAEMIKRMSGAGIFHAREVDGDSGRILEVTYHRDGRIWMTAWVDPNQGYATVQTEHDTGDLPSGRRQSSSRKVRVKKLADGVWAPDLIEATNEHITSERTILAKARLDMDAMTLNQTPAAESFNWRSLNYRGTQVYIHQEGDQTVQVSFLGKYLEPPLKMDAEQKALAEHYIRKLAY